MTELHDGSAVPERETGENGAIAARGRSGDRGGRCPSPVAGTSLYFRQDVAELRKVI